MSLIRPASASCLLETLAHITCGRGRAEVGEPRRHLPARLVERQPADVDDHAGVFGDGNEVRRRHQPAHRVAPAQQRLESGDAAGAQRDDRLVVQLEGALVDRVAQVGLELQPRHGALRASPGSKISQARVPTPSARLSAIAASRRMSSARV